MRSLRLPLLVLFVYAFVLPWLPGLRSPGELARLYLARALVEDRTLALDGEVARHGDLPDLLERDGHRYAPGAPGLSFAGAGVHAVLRAVHRGVSARPHEPSTRVAESSARVESSPRTAESSARVAESSARPAESSPRPAESSARVAESSARPEEPRSGVSKGEAPTEREEVFWLRLVTCMLPGAIAAELLRRVLARRFDPQLATAGAVVFALGSLMWPYSVLLLGHGPAAAALVACWWALDEAFARSGTTPSARAHAVARSGTSHSARPEEPAERASRRARRTTTLLLFLSGLLAGSALLLDHATLIALVPLAVWAAATLRRGLRFTLATLAGLLPPLLLLGAYHRATSGDALAPLVTLAASLGAPSFAALRESFVDPARGIFAWAPFLALGVPGLAVLWHMDRGLAALCTAEFLLHALFAASLGGATWSWGVGPRHLVPLCAFLVAPALAAADQLRRGNLGFLPAGLALFGVAVLALAAAVGPYLPDDLTNPVHQLLLPLARGGLRSPDLLSLALHTRAWWTLLPWVAALGLAAAALVPLSTAPGFEPGPMTSALAGALAALLFAGHSHLGGNDRFEDTRQFMREQLGEAGRSFTDGPTVHADDDE